MSQNVYDRPDFFKAYTERIDRSEENIATDNAWSRLRPLLPEDVKGLDVIDFGCGSGWFCRWAKSQDANSVYGLDLSEKMLERAEGLTRGKYTGIEYHRADLDTLELSSEHDGKYDLGVSLLALHYLVNLPTLAVLIHRVLKPGATFVFNVEHPIRTAPTNPRVVQDPETGEKVWSFKDYGNEGLRILNWLAPDIRKQHHTVMGYLSCFFNAGFDVTGFVEWVPTEDELTRGKATELDTLRPAFMMVRVRKRDY